MQTPGSEFVDDYGIRWVWDAASQSMQMATHMDKNTLDQATGGDTENSFATDQSPDGKWEKTDNPLDEGIMTYGHNLEDIHPSDCPCEKCEFRREQEYQPQVHTKDEPFFDREPHRNRMKYDDSFPSMISTGGFGDATSYGPMLTEVLADATRLYEAYRDPQVQPGQVDEHAIDSACDALLQEFLGPDEGLSAYGFSMNQLLHENPWLEGYNNNMNPGDIHEFQGSDIADLVAANLSEAAREFIHKTSAATTDAIMNDLFSDGPALDASQWASWFKHPDTGQYHISAPGAGHGSMPEYRELMGANARDTIPLIQGAGMIRNGEIIHDTGQGHEPMVARAYERHRQVYPELPPIMDRTLISPPDPNPMPENMMRKRDILNPKTYAGTNMTDMPADRRGPHYLQRYAWEDSQPSLSECPSCQGPMVDKNQEKICHDCGTRQPVVYAQRQAGIGDIVKDVGMGAALAAPWLLGPEVGAPADAAILGGEGALEGGAALGLGEGAAGALGIGGSEAAPVAGDAALGGSSGWMGSAMSKGKQYAQMKGFEDITGLGNNGQGGGGAAQPAPGPDPNSYGVLSHIAGSEEDGSSATKNDGQDIDPSIISTDGNTNRDGDDPSHMKDHDTGMGDGTENLQQTMQEILDHVHTFAMDPELDGSSDPIVQALDALLEAKMPGYRGKPEDQSAVIIEAEPETADSGDSGESAVGESSESSDADKKESRTARGEYSNPEVGALIDQWMANQIDDGTLEAGLQQIKMQMGNAQAGPVGNSGYEMENDRTPMGIASNVHWSNLPMPGQQNGAVPVMQTVDPNQSAGGSVMGGPCEICGGAHDSSMHGAASQGEVGMHAVANFMDDASAQDLEQAFASGAITPQQYRDALKMRYMQPQQADPFQMAQPPQQQQQQFPGFQGSVKEARRPKMCPYHSDIVDYSLTLGDPSLALQSITPQAYGNAWCKSPEFGHTCNFKPAMVKQEYWDNRKMELEQARLEREQETVFQQQEEALPQVEEVQDPSMDSVDQGGYDPAPATDTAVGAPMEMAARVAAWTDGTGQPLIEGQTYLMKSPQYAIPDKVTIDNVKSPNKLEVTVHSDMMDYTDQITHDDLATNGFQFMPDPSVQQEQQGGEYQPEENNDYPFYDDPAGVTDNSDLPTPVSHTDNADLNAGLEYLLDGGGGEFEGVAPEVLASLGMGHTAGKDFSHAEQQAFINEAGRARNMDSLDLTGTHYSPLDEYRDLDDEISFW